jgi:chemotaxis protein MotB
VSKPEGKQAGDLEKPKIVFKRHHGHDGHAAHGGAWKIAYADFVTAMMAFFLLMWLLSGSNKYELEGISDYFSRPISAVFNDTGSSSSVLQGGGTDPTRNKGDIRSGDPKDPKNKLRASKMPNTKAAEEELKKFKLVAQALKQAVDANPELRKLADQIRVDITSEGLRVQIIDEQNRPMFASGSAEMQPYTKEILRELAKVFREMPNGITISGHTDAAPYSGSDRGYSNWELSSDRANAARRQLAAHDVGGARIKRVVGLSSAVNINPAPLSAENRRISIILMTAEAEQQIKDSGQPTIDINQSNLPTAQSAASFATTKTPVTETKQ